jgi:nicotinate-nucleotide adenylyltransferase
MMMHNLYTETIVSSMISEKRMNHVRRVTDLTRRLAIRYGIDADRAVLAGLFHDAVKQWPKDQLLLWMRRYRPQLISLDPQIWHSYVAADMLKHKYHVRDKAVLQAIAHHVQGFSDQLLAKILYIADKIEPGRTYDTRVLIDLAFRDIHRTMRIVKANQNEYLGKERMNDTDGNHH